MFLNCSFLLFGVMKRFFVYGLCAIGLGFECFVFLRVLDCVVLLACDVDLLCVLFMFPPPPCSFVFFVVICVLLVCVLCVVFDCFVLLCLCVVLGILFYRVLFVLSSCPYVIMVCVVLDLCVLLFC